MGRSSRSKRRKKERELAKDEANTDPNTGKPPPKVKFFVFSVCEKLCRKGILPKKLERRVKGRYVTEAETQSLDDFEDDLLDVLRDSSTVPPLVIIRWLDRCRNGLAEFRDGRVPRLEDCSIRQLECFIKALDEQEKNQWALKTCDVSRSVFDAARVKMLCKLMVDLEFVRHLKVDHCSGFGDGTGDCTNGLALLEGLLDFKACKSFSCRRVYPPTPEYSTFYERLASVLRDHRSLTALHIEFLPNYDVEGKIAIPQQGMQHRGIADILDVVTGDSSCELSTLTLAHCQLSRIHQSALRQLAKDNDTLTAVDLANNALDADTFESMARSLSNNRTLTRLNLEGNRGMDEGLKAILAALSNSKHMKHLNIGMNGGTPGCCEGVRLFFEQNDRIMSFEYNGNVLGKNGVVIAQELRKQGSTDCRLQKLGLAATRIRHNFATEFVRYVPTSMLTEVDLSHNHFDRQTARILAYAGIANPRMRAYDLGPNNLSHSASLHVEQALNNRRWRKYCADKARDDGPDTGSSDSDDVERQRNFKVRRRRRNKNRPKRRSRSRNTNDEGSGSDGGGSGDGGSGSDGDDDDDARRKRSRKGRRRRG